MLQFDKSDDFIIATGQTHTVRDFIETAAKTAGYEIAWEGKGVEEKGRDKKSGKIIVEIDPKFYRHEEKTVLCGDASKARDILGWKPSVTFEQLVEMMMKSDLELVK